MDGVSAIQPANRMLDDEDMMEDGDRKLQEYHDAAPRDEVCIQPPWLALSRLPDAWQQLQRARCAVLESRALLGIHLPGL